ncbi:flagellar basal body rod protein FlgC [Fictibacillus sp. KIGAM418]|uniref:Flagellar basal-body rod protein FlgC n=1 Tax=Fictibacillus marinisediminis TaxID=2878389 RepID=A0A9X2BF80_9BACL|nr:flagellar basal body rod protein FlgC [Fictibacillus marinisediminis]MCK6257007.1 flagellar basal body rod protein FlgC [Fictibacillus marinisediminis]
MGMFDALNNSASALTAQRLKMDVVSSNIANADSTRGKLVNGKWEPYRRKMVVTEPNGSSFNTMFQTAVDSRSGGTGGGVKVDGIVDDQTPFKMVYQPDHPDADKNGYIKLPNVDPLKEMVDLVSSTRSYEANVTALNAAKGMYLKALEIGR